MNVILKCIRSLHLHRIFCLLCILCLHAQNATWRSSGGPEGGNISSIIAIDSILIAGANPGGIYRSTDMGESWQFVGSGTRARFITNIDTLGSILIASAKAGGMQQYALSFSYNKGATWSENESIWPFMGIEAFTIHENSIFVKVQQGVLFRSDDTAKTWISLANNVPSGLFLNVNMFYSNKDTLLAATNGGVMYTADNGKTWLDISRNIPDTAFTTMQLYENVVYSITAHFGVIYVGTRSAVYRMNGIQNEWENILRLKNDIIVHSLFIKEDTILAGTHTNGLYRSINNGQSWQNEIFKTLNPTWFFFNYCYGSLFAGTDGNLYKSLNLGATWLNKAAGIKAMHIRDISNVHDTIYASSWGGGVSYKKKNEWVYSNMGLSNWAASSLTTNYNDLYAGTIGSGVFKYQNGDWQLLSGYQDSLAKYWIVRDVCSAYSKLFIGASGGLFVSSDSGKTITKVAGSGMIIDVNCLYKDPFSDNLLIGSNQGVFKYNTIKNTLSDQLLGHLTYAISGNQKSLFAGAWRQGVLRSDNNGEIWTKTSLQLPTNVPVIALASTRDSIFAGTDGLGVFFSSDNGDTWQEFNDGLTCPLVKALHIHDDILYAGTNGGSVFEMPLTVSNATINLSKHLNAPSISAIAKKNSIIIHIQNSNAKDLSLNIMDITGRTIYSATVQSNRKISIPMPLASNTYILQIKGQSVDFKQRLLTIK
jgi:photosystem II stability/assembly factor-like uncharacterized protein